MIKGNHQNKEYHKEFIDAIEAREKEKEERRLFALKVIYLKNNYKELTKGLKAIPANWPSFGVTTVHISQVRK